MTSLKKKKKTLLRIVIRLKKKKFTHVYENKSFSVET